MPVLQKNVADRRSDTLVALLARGNSLEPDHPVAFVWQRVCSIARILGIVEATLLSLYRRGVIRWSQIIQLHSFGKEFAPLFESWGE